MGLLSRIRASLKLGSSHSTTRSGARAYQPHLAVNPDLPIKRRIVDNRVFLLGLDQLYRDAIRRHEQVELLPCARTVAAALKITPAEVPVEGYYAEDPHLAEYFKLMRALQNARQNRAVEVAALPEFRRLVEVTSAPLYGRSIQEDKLLPVGRDPLSQALRDTMPNWTLAGLTAQAYAVAQETDDISLVGLAARAQDSVALAALRESVVLYAELVVGARPRPMEFVWQVDGELAEQGRRFVDAFNALFGDELPLPTPEQAALYWFASREADIVGRCVRLGVNDRTSPVRHYHWAICHGADEELRVHEFWDDELWTTTRYQTRLRLAGRCPDL